MIMYYSNDALNMSTRNQKREHEKFINDFLFLLHLLPSSLFVASPPSFLFFSFRLHRLYADLLFIFGFYSWVPFAL